MEKKCEFNILIVIHSQCHIFISFLNVLLFWRLTSYHFKHENLSTKKTFPSLWTKLPIIMSNMFSFWEPLLLFIDYSIYSNLNHDIILSKLFLLRVSLSITKSNGHTSFSFYGIIRYLIKLSAPSLEKLITSMT